MNTEPASLLIVDDEELNREGLGRRLRRDGYAVALAKSGREAIELLGERRFDLVLLDLMLPGMNGLEAAARVQQAFLPSLPPEVPGARFAWVFRPSRELAGDFLNVFRLDDRHLGLCVLDVNGHGVAAALLALTASQQMARTAGPPPA